MLMSRLNEPLNFYYPISFPVVMIIRAVDFRNIACRGQQAKLVVICAPIGLVLMIFTSLWLVLKRQHLID